MKTDLDNSIEIDPTYRIRDSIGIALKESARALHKYRNLIHRQVLHDLFAPIRQTYLGLLWRILNPLIPMSLYIALHYAGIFRSPSHIPHVLYVTIGFCLWGAFSTSFLTSTRLLETQASILTKVRIPFIVSYVSAQGDTLFDLFLRTLVVFGVALSLGDINVAILCTLLPLLAFPLVVLGIALGIFTSMFNVYVKDVKNVALIAVNYGVYISGVIFPLPNLWWVEPFRLWNPIYSYLEASRGLIVMGELSLPLLLLPYTVLLFAAFATFRLYAVESHLIEGM